MLPGLHRLELGALLAWTALQIAVLWWLPYPPFQDLPLHLETTRILQDHLLGTDSVFHRAFAMDVGLDPNGLIYVPWVAASLAVGPLAAGKMVASLYLILFPLALFYALRGVRTDAGYLALSGPLLAWSFLFTMGFLNFCAALVLSLLTFGYWARRRRGFSTADGMVLTVGWLLTVFLHPVPALFAIWLISACGLAGVWSRCVRGSTPLRRFVAERRPLPLIAAAVPTLGVVVVFLTGSSSEDTLRLPFQALWVHLFTFNPLVSFGLWERLAGAAFVLALGIAAWIGLRRPGTRLSRGLLVATLGLLGVYFLAPAGLAGGGYLNPRLLLCAGLAAVLWLAGRPALDDFRGPVAGAGIVLTSALLVLQVPVMTKLGRQVEEVVEVGWLIPQGASVATLSWSHRGIGGDGEALSRRVAPMHHALGYASVERGLLDLGHYHASQPYFPIRYRQPCDPFEFLWTADLARQPATVDLGGWESRGCRVDYFLVWGRRGRPLPSDVDALYERIGESDAGDAELYGRRSGGNRARISGASTEATQR